MNLKFHVRNQPRKTVNQFKLVEMGDDGIGNADGLTCYQIDGPIVQSDKGPMFQLTMLVTTHKDFQVPSDRIMKALAESLDAAMKSIR